MPAYTKTEVRQKFLNHIKMLRNYWLNESRAETSKEKMDGFIHSLLVMFDGGSTGLPAFNISLSPHPDDKEYHISNGTNYYESDMVINDDCQLHEIFSFLENK